MKLNHSPAIKLIKGRVIRQECSSTCPKVKTLAAPRPRLKYSSKTIVQQHKHTASCIRQRYVVVSVIKQGGAFGGWWRRGGRWWAVCVGTRGGIGGLLGEGELPRLGDIRLADGALSGARDEQGKSARRGNVRVSCD